MAMVCPKCNGNFERQLQCPKCGVRLLYQPEFKSIAPTNNEEQNQWQQTPWGRLVVGLAIAQGLSHGLQWLTKAGLLATGEETNVWSTLTGLVLLHTLQGFSLLIAGTLTGAGQRRGFLYGSFVGLLNGLIFVAVQPPSTELGVEIAFLGQPILHMLVGGLGGLLGMLIWKPLPLLNNEKTKRSFGLPSFQFLAGPVHWARVIVGAGIVVAGGIWAQNIQNFVFEASQGTLNVTSHFQARLFSMEILGLTILIGSGFAGATTLNGVKQGLCVGFLAGVILIGIDLARTNDIDEILFRISSTFCLSIAGGWFGSQLLPPLAPRRRVRTIDA